ncbi:MAG: AMIN domain-containing protein, partial [Burkholderiaceae bacterium]
MKPSRIRLSRRQALTRMGSLALALTATDLAFGASILAVRLWPALDYTRVTLESDVALTAKHFVAENPARLVIDVDGLELSPALRELVGKVRADDPYIAGLRIGQNQPRVVRLVVDLKQSVDPEVFSLTPVAAYQHRLVFDLKPAQERDPLLQLIRDKAQAESSASKEVQDALGEFLARRNNPGSESALAPTATAPPPPASLPPALQQKIDRL